MGATRKLVHAGLPPMLAVCAGMLLLTPASAQTEPSADPKIHPIKKALVHPVPPLPTTTWDYHAITPEGRLLWFTSSTVGPKTLTAGLFSAALGTALDRPHEYGPHWSGFGQRYGIRFTGVSTGNAIEVGLGSAWGEDPRYFHTVNQPLRDRLVNVLDLGFRAYRSDGKRHPAFARYIAIFANNFASNSWRVPSESDWQHAMTRSGEGFGARCLSNAFNEFVPQLWRQIRHRSNATDSGP